MDRKEVAKQLREEAAQLIKAADMLDGTTTGKRRGRPPGFSPAKKAAKKRVGRPPGKKSAKKAARKSAPAIE